MRKEEDCSADSKYLYCAEAVSDEAISNLKQETIKLYRSGHSKWDEQLLSQYLSWERKANEVALYTLYAYADLPVPIEYDCLFNINKPEEYVVSELIITQSIYEGFYPISTIEYGHKHLLVCSFKNGIIPSIINQLADKSTHSSQSEFMLGICSFKNYPHI